MAADTACLYSSGRTRVGITPPSASKGLSFQTATRLVVNTSDSFRFGLLVRSHHLARSEFDSQFVELAGEAERRLVVLVVDARAGINPDIEGLVDRHEGRDRVWDRLAGDFLAVYRQNTGATFAHARTVVLEVKQDGVFTRRERLRAFPAELFQSQQVVGEDRLALD